MELNGIFDWEVERLNIKTGPSDNLIGSLSGGNQQKVMIARSFAQHPKVLILNDPARGIDISTKRDLYIHLRKYVEEEIQLFSYLVNWKNLLDCVQK